MASFGRSVTRLPSEASSGTGILSLDLPGLLLRSFAGDLGMGSVEASGVFDEVLEELGSIVEVADGAGVGNSGNRCDKLSDG